MADLTSFYLEIGSCIFENRQLIVCDAILSFDTPTYPVQDPLLLLDPEDRPMCLAVDDIDNSRPWLVFLKINPFTDQPESLITIKDECMEGDIREEHDFNWRPIGNIYNDSSNLGIFDFENYDDYDLAIHLDHELAFRGTTAWYHYVTQLSDKAKEQHNCAICPFGVISSSQKERKYDVYVLESAISDIIGIKLSLIPTVSSSNWIKPKNTASYFKYTPVPQQTESEWLEQLSSIDLMIVSNEESQALVNKRIIKEI